ncbi:MAG: M1 family aminopeptidase [Bacteroidota bacterium]
MIILRFFAVCTFVCSSLLLSSEIERYDYIQSQLKNLSVLKDSVFRVSNVTLTRDVGTFTFHDGFFYTLSLVDNSVAALLFVGNGTFTFIPPTDIEQKHLNRFLEKKQLNEEFKYLFLLFTDSTFKELSRNCTFIPSPVPASAITLLSEAQKYLQNDELTHYDFDILRAFLPRQDYNWFYAQIETEEDGSLFYEIDDMEVEEVTLSHKPGSYRGRISPYFRETINSFHKQSEYLSPESLNDEYKSTFTPIHYKIDVRLNKNLEADIRCDIIGKNLRYQTDWLDFTILRDLIIDSVLSRDGKRIPSHKEKQSPVLWLHDPQTFSTTDTLSFTFYYHGEIITQIDFWRELKQSNGWYPYIRNIGIDRYTFDLTFQHPSNLNLVSSGKRIRNETTGDITTSLWKVERPTVHASFAVGTFEEYTVDSTDQLPIVFYTSKNYQHSSLLAGDIEKSLAHDLKNSLRFFTHIFGPPPINELKAVEIAGGHGQAFPDLLHLSWYTFQNRLEKDKGVDQAFRAHEVAHMWWGLGISWKSYHDYWLSEAFAEYSGMWYMQTVLRDNETFFERLNNYKKAILGARKYLLSSGQESGPVWLGSRTQSSNTAGDYDLIVYKKGAWILHMLRNMAIDLKIMKEDVFQNMLKEFYRTYNGRNASTEDFQKVTEKYFGTSMQWFFDQWVYNTEIPTYTISYKLEHLPTGKYKVHCIVKQANVPDNFQMYVPFLITFGENKFARLRYLIKGPVTEFDFPILPLKPEEITFNDLESVLCEIEDEDWE